MKLRMSCWMPWLIAVGLHAVLLFFVGVRFRERPLSVKPILVFWGALFSDDELLENTTPTDDMNIVPTHETVLVPDRSMFGRFTVDKPFVTTIHADQRRWFKDDFLKQHNPTASSREGRKSPSTRANDPLMRQPAPLPPLRWGYGPSFQGSD